MGNARKNCTIGNIFCLHHITGMSFIIRLTLYICIVEDTDTFPKHSLIHHETLNNPTQGSYWSWKTWKVMEFDNLDSRPGKSWNFGPGHGKSWNLMLANMYAVYTVLDCPKCMRESTLNYGKM